MYKCLHEFSIKTVPDTNFTHYVVLNTKKTNKNAANTTFDVENLRPATCFGF